MLVRSNQTKLNSFYLITKISSSSVKVIYGGSIFCVGIELYEEERMEYGYVRVSSKTQNPDRQIRELKKMAF